MRVHRNGGLAVAFGGFLALAGCGGEPPLDVNQGQGGSAAKLDGGTIQQAAEYKAEGLSTGYSGGGNGGSEPTK